MKDVKTGQVKTTTFDAVVVCAGFYTHYRWPEIVGLKSFGGQVLHSGQHGDDMSVYKGKRVVVIGMGSSGCDVAVDVSQSASKVSLLLAERVKSYVRSYAC